MNKNIVGAIGALFLYGLMSTESHASLVLYGALTSGGDTLISAYDEDGNDYDLKAGGLFHFALGYDNKFESGSGIRITYGYKFDSLDADNGDAEITRFPLEAALYKTFSERHNLGAGLVYEMSPQYEEDVSGYSINIDFNDATGYMFYYGYSINNFEWGFRYTEIEYEYSDSFFSLDLDGSNFGLYASVTYD